VVTAHDQDAAEPFVITTPLYYVNAAPHLGGAYSTMAVDVVARYQRLRGRPVTMITGTDEHGEKIAVSAANAGLEPKAHCDAVVQSYKHLWQQLDIQYDSFIRTTDPHHEALVGELLTRCYEAGDIYKANYEGYYCVDCEEYKDEADMDEHHNCPTHRRPCQQRSEENYFFRLSKYHNDIMALLQKDTGFCVPESRRNEVMAWVSEGLRDFSISRSAAAMSWGIPLPMDPSHNTYVWFDALAGYLSALAPEGTASDKLLDTAAAAGWPATHVIGKDILRFHAVYWPGMLLSAGLPLPHRVFGHGFLTAAGQKMGKSMGNVVDPLILVKAYGADAVRFYFMAELEFGKDGDFSELRFQEKVNASLANDIGNLLNRTLGLLTKNCGGVLPVSASEIPADHPMRIVAEQQVPETADAYERMAPHAAAAAATALSRACNLHLATEAPWTAFKKGDEAEKEAASRTLVAMLEAVRIVAVLLAPITPAMSQRIFDQLAITDSISWEDTAWGGLKAGQTMSTAQPVFQRLEGDFVIQKTAEVATAV